MVQISQPVGVYNVLVNEDSGDSTQGLGEAGKEAESLGPDGFNI